MRKAQHLQPKASDVADAEVGCFASSRLAAHILESTLQRGKSPLCKQNTRSYVVLTYDMKRPDWRELLAWALFAAVTAVHLLSRGQLEHCTQQLAEAEEFRKRPLSDELSSAVGYAENATESMVVGDAPGCPANLPHRRKTACIGQPAFHRNAPGSLLERMRGGFDCVCTCSAAECSHA
jgi:hypothetical protein